MPPRRSAAPVPRSPQNPATAYILLQNLDVGHTLPVACQTLQKYLHKGLWVNSFLRSVPVEMERKSQARARSAAVFALDGVGEVGGIGALARGAGFQQNAEQFFCGEAEV